VSFLRGTTPFTNLSLRDQTVDRVWQGGIRATPFPRLSISFAGNFVRTTGSGEIYGEAPLYGPMSFPYATGSVHYDFRFGKTHFAIAAHLLYRADCAGEQFQCKFIDHWVDEELLIRRTQ